MKELLQPFSFKENVELEFKKIKIEIVWENNLGFVKGNHPDPLVLFKLLHV